MIELCGTDNRRQERSLACQIGGCFEILASGTSTAGGTSKEFPRFRIKVAGPGRPHLQPYLPTAIEAHSIGVADQDEGGPETRMGEWLDVLRRTFGDGNLGKDFATGLEPADSPFPHYRPSPESVKAAQSSGADLPSFVGFASTSPPIPGTI